MKLLAVLFAWYFLHLGAYGRGYVAGPFDTLDDCDAVRSSVINQYTVTKSEWLSRCWEFRGFRYSI